MEAVVLYLKKTFKKNRNIEYVPKTYENEHDFMNWLEAQTHVTNIPSKGAVVYAYTDMNSNGLHEVWLESVTNHGDPYFSIYEERKNGGYKKISSGQ
jgi:hypothetical protein